MKRRYVYASFFALSRAIFIKLRDTVLYDKFKKALLDLKNDPYIGQVKHGDLSGIYCIDLYHMGTNYEVAYRIYEREDKRAVVILAGTRENFYKELSRLI